MDRLIRPSSIASARRCRLLSVLVIAQLLGFVCANQLVLEGSDGIVQFGEAPSDPSIRRVPNPDGGPTDQLAVAGASGLLVDGTITANLLDLNSTGGTVTANELIVNSLTVLDGSGGQQASASNCSVKPRITMFAPNGISDTHHSSVLGISGMDSVNVWTLDPTQSIQYDGVFSLTNSQTVTVAQNGYYEISLEQLHAWSASSDYRFVAVEVAVNGVLRTGSAKRYCMNFGARGPGDPHKTTCLLTLPQGAVLGTFAFRAVTGATLFSAIGNSSPLWTITQLGTY